MPTAGSNAILSRRRGWITGWNVTLTSRFSVSALRAISAIWGCAQLQHSCCVSPVRCARAGVAAPPHFSHRKNIVFWQDNSPSLSTVWRTRSKSQMKIEIFSIICKKYVVFKRKTRPVTVVYKIQKRTNGPGQSSAVRTLFNDGSWRNYLWDISQGPGPLVVTIKKRVVEFWDNYF